MNSLIRYNYVLFGITGNYFWKNIRDERNHSLKKIANYKIGYFFNAARTYTITVWRPVDGYRPKFGSNMVKKTEEDARQLIISLITNKDIRKKYEVDIFRDNGILLERR